MSEPDGSAVLDLAVELAHAAGEIQMRRFRSFDPREARLKGRRNPVTQSDVESEKRIVDGIRRAHPEARIVAEEGGVQDGSVDLEWIVDPLDGTVNYAHGLPVFAVSIAVLRRGRPLVSVVHAPALRDTYTAVAGEGAFLNGEPIKVSGCPAIHEALLATGFSYHRNQVEDDNVGHFDDLILQCRDIRRMGSAALDLAWVAAGRYDAFWELYLSPWDIAAGIHLVDEAGGRVTDLQGGSEVLKVGHLLASNGSALHEELLQILGRRPPQPSAA